MNLRQLIEGQKEQILGLSPNTPVTLYHPTDINGAADIIMGKSHLDHYFVVPALKYAVKYGDVVIRFYGQGRHLEASRSNHEMASQKYPDSFNPSVTFSLLSLDPRVFYTGHLAASNIEKLYVMTNGAPEEMVPSEFIKYAIAHDADAQRQRRG